VQIKDGKNPLFRQYHGFIPCNLMAATAKVEVPTGNMKAKAVAAVQSVKNDD